MERARGTGWRFGRVGGVDLLVKPSLLVMGAVLVAVFVPRFEARGESDPLLLAIAFVGGLYVSVLVHELAHVAVARAYGMPVHSVTLHLLGGETLIEGESRTPRQELAVAGAGPLASLAIGVAGLVLAPVLAGTAEAIVSSVAFVNIVVAGFNMLPGLPLDGGRVFHAIVWQLTGRSSVGVRIAAWIGMVSAVAVVAAVFAFDRGSEQLVLDLVLALIVAWFLWRGSADALRMLRQTERLDRLVARELAIPGETAPPGTARLPADLRGAELVHALAATPADTYVLTESDGREFGVLHTRAVDDAYRASGR